VGNLAGATTGQVTHPVSRNYRTAFVVNSKDAWNRKTHVLGARVRHPYVYFMIRFRFSLFLARR
jgi:hypothetical protein